MFKLIDFAFKLEKLEESNTQITYRCPVCGGKNLKLNKNTNAYACYSNNCEPRLIRKKVGYKVRDTSKYKNKTKHSLFVKEILPTSNDIFFDKIDNYEPAKIIRLNKSKTITKYKYNDNCMVERLDDGNKKYCYPKYLNNNVWVYGSNNNFGFFNDRFLRNEKKTILLVEGEKVADILTKTTNILTLSIPAFGWNKDYIVKWISKNIKSIKNVIIFPDNDDIGKNKANIVKYSFWSVGFPCASIDLSKYFSMDIGEDIADLIDNNVNMLEVLENINNYVQ